MIDILNELRIVKQECRQLKTQVENVVPQPTEATGGRIETHIVSTSAQDQDNAVESNQALWRSVQELQALKFKEEFRRESLRIRPTSVWNLHDDPQ